MDMNANVRVLAIGAATQDVFVSGKSLAAKRDVRTHQYVEMLPVGEKLELDEVHFDTGGGAHNAAVTFARQGLKASFVGKIGHDPAGAEVLRVMRREKVAIDHIATDSKLATGYSVLLLTPTGERTVLVYRGASSHMRGKDFRIPRLDADWFYITSLAGNLDLLKALMQQAKARGAQVAFNPGSGELKQTTKLRKLLGDISVLIANRSEMETLFEETDTKKLLLKGVKHVEMVVMTDAQRGSYVCDGKRIYGAGQYARVKVMDRTGAGDAFGSGFVASLALGGDIEQALTFASANSTSVVQQVGAKAGILKATRLKKMQIKSVSI